MGKMLEEMRSWANSTWAKRSAEMNAHLMEISLFTGKQLLWEEIAKATGLPLREVLLVLGGEQTDLYNYNKVEKFVNKRLQIAKEGEENKSETVKENRQD